MFLFSSMIIVYLFLYILQHPTQPKKLVSSMMVVNNTANEV